ncbi:MAG: DUF2938 domain-containing protein [Pseudomonadota bacterium]
MNNMLELIVRIVLIGIGATAVMDIVALTAKRLFGIPMSDWAMVGRWIGHFPQGQFRHASIAKATPVPGESVIGWAAHYFTGIAYAAVLVAIGGTSWLRSPTPVLALGVGIAMLVAPFFIMQPGMGAGIAASKTPNPKAARLRSLMNHVAFGLGLYLTALVVVHLPLPL